MNEMNVAMDIPEGATVIFDQPIVGFFTYWIELTAPFMLGAIGHAISRELWGHNTRQTEA